MKNNLHLNGKSWHARLYMNSKKGVENETELPKNFCSYFWDIVWYVVTLPFTWVGLLFTSNSYNKNWLSNFLFTAAAVGPVFSALFIGAAFTYTFMPIGVSTFIPHFIIGSIALIIAALFLFFIESFLKFYLKIVKRFKEKRKAEYKEIKGPSFILTKWRALKTAP